MYQTIILSLNPGQRASTVKCLWKGPDILVMMLSLVGSNSLTPALLVTTGGY
jgi:hypothetical protein